MPRPALRSRSLRRIKVRTPGGKLVTRYKRRRPGPARCAVCKKPLSGIPRARRFEIKRISKSKKRPERPYGGNLCPKCARVRIKQEKIFKLAE